MLYDTLKKTRGYKRSKYTFLDWGVWGENFF